jgi:hypothetical protein
MLFCVAGCFDVKRVEVTGALEIDDFEDGDQVPSSDRFEFWACFDYESSLVLPPPCGTTAPGSQESQHAEAMTFELGAPLNGKDSSVGAGMGVWPPIAAPVDVSQWQKLSFDAQLEPSAPAASDETVAWIRLKCGGLANGSVPGDLMIEQRVTIGRDWSTFSLGLRRDPADPLAQPGFRQPGFQVALMPIDPDDCLTMVSGLTFEVQRTDGQPGTLTIDNVVLE